MPRFQNQGYAAEAARALIKYFEEVKNIHEFLGMTDSDNENARRMFRRLGFEDRGEREVDGVEGEGKVCRLSIWTLNVRRPLEEYGIGPKV